MLQTSMRFAKGYPTIALALALAACSQSPADESNIDTDASKQAVEAEANVQEVSEDTPPVQAAQSVAQEDAPENAPMDIESPKNRDLDQVEAAASPATAETAQAATAPQLATTTAREVAAASPPPSFAQCKTCHTIATGERSGFGPNLAGIAGKKAGAVAGYAYSPAMKASDVRWTAETLDAFLKVPQSVIPGTTMAYGGLKDASARKAVVDYVLSQ